MRALKSIDRTLADFSFMISAISSCEAPSTYASQSIHHNAAATPMVSSFVEPSWVFVFFVFQNAGAERTPFFELGSALSGTMSEALRQLRFVDGLGQGFLGIHHPAADEIRQRVVEEPISGRLAGLHGARDLVHLALADEV